MSFEERLIECVRRHNIAFQRRGMKEHAWKIAARELNSDVKTCRTRWRSLRDTYRRHCKGNHGTRRKWKYLKSLSFLNKYQYEIQDISEPTEEDGDSGSLLTEMIPLKREPELDISNSYDAYDSDEFFPSSALPPLTPNPTKRTVAYEMVEASMSSPVEASMSPVAQTIPCHCPSPPVTLETTPYDCLPPPPDAKKPKKSRHEKDPVQQEMLQLLRKASDHLSSKPEKVSSTRKLLDSLATKIDDAQLPLNVLNRLEIDLLTLVHTALENNVRSG